MNKEMVQSKVDEAVKEAIQDYKTSRYKNPYFWVGIGGIALAAMGIDPESLTSWSIVLDNFLEFIKNPVAIVGTALALMGVFVDPTTKGIKDPKK